MADDHHSLRLPRALWERYEDVVGNIGRTADLKLFMDWRIDNPEVTLGPDVPPPHDFSATFRIEELRWEMFADTVGPGKVSGHLRRYVRWRVRNPDLPLPGRRLPPMRRNTRPVACV